MTAPSLQAPFPGCLLLSLAAFAILLTACTSPRLEREFKDKPIGKIYQPGNIYAAERLPQNLRTVVVLPPHTENLPFPFMESVYRELVTSLRAEGRFQVITLPEEDLLDQINQLSLAPEDPLPDSLLRFLASRYKADAILNLHITAFRPYKPLVLGIRANLAALPSTTILWSCDEVFDAGNERVTRGARKFSEKQLEQAFPLQSSYSSLHSPRRFAAYVGHTLFQTLPPR